jgi:fused signal recognition particle receptor
MELVLIALLILVVGGAVALVALRRRETTLEPPAVPVEERREPGAAPEVLPEAPPVEPPAPPTGPAGVAPPAPPELAVEIGEPLVVEAPVEPEPEPEPEVEPEPAVKPSFRARLGKARAALSGYVGSVLARDKIDAETWDELEEALIRADVGVSTTTDILDRLRATVRDQGISDPHALLEALKAQLKGDLALGDRSLRFEPGAPNVWLFVGVNGVGKTTTIGKLGKQQAADGRSVIMAAGDTFRAAAAEQLGMWAERAAADFVRGDEGGDPSAIIFDAVQRAAARGHDLVLADTAGRLHTKVNLMEELRKVRRVADRDPGKVTEVLLVLDATTGQNGLVQAQQFTEAVELTGVVLTKLDGSAKGGIALAIQATLGIPIKLVGLGETADDLVDFDPDEFVDALFAES